MNNTAKKNISFVVLAQRNYKIPDHRKQAKSVKYDRLFIIRKTKLKANKERSAFNTLPEEASRELFLLPEIFNPVRYLGYVTKKKLV